MHSGVDTYNVVHVSTTLHTHVHAQLHRCAHACRDELTHVWTGLWPAVHAAACTYDCAYVQLNVCSGVLLCIYTTPWPPMCVYIFLCLCTAVQQCTHMIGHGSRHMHKIIYVPFKLFPQTLPHWNPYRKKVRPPWWLACVYHSKVRASHIHNYRPPLTRILEEGVAVKDLENGQPDWVLPATIYQHIILYRCSERSQLNFNLKSVSTYWQIYN